MARKGPEDKMVDKAVAAAKARYGERIVIVRYPKGPYSVAGISDLLVCLDGYFGAAEAKAPVEAKSTHPVSIKQKAFLSRIERAGGASTVFRSVEEFMEFLSFLETHDV